MSAPITVGKSPHGAAITPDGKRGPYVANTGDDTVSVITAATGGGVGPDHRGQDPFRRARDYA